MPSQLNNPASAPQYDKRRPFDEGRALVDAAHIATYRLYGEVLAFWRNCPKRPCRRHRRCACEPTACLMRNLLFVPQAERLKAEQEVIAGGPRRLAPATHVEWQVRRTALATLMSWRFSEPKTG